MADPEKHRKFLMVFAAFSFSFPISNRIHRIIFTIVFAILWIAEYVSFLSNHLFMLPSTIVNTISQTNIYVVVLTGLSLWITGNKYNNRINQIWRQLMHVDRTLRWQHTNSNIHIWCSFITWIIFMTSTLFSVVIIISAQRTISSGYYLSYLIPICGINSLFVIFINIVEELRLRFQFILDNIKNLKTEINYIRRKSQLLSLQTAHLDICHIIDIINSTFGTSLLAMTAALLIQLLTSLYTFAFSMKCLGLEMIFGDGAFQLLFVVPNLIIIGYITYICEITVKTGQKCGKCLHILSRQLPEEAQSYIEMFSLQIYLNGAKFTAADFFTLDKSLIFSVIGGLFTYLIILIQFTNETSVCHFIRQVGETG